MPKMRENCKNGPFSILKIGVAQNAYEIHSGFFQGVKIKVLMTNNECA